MWKMRRPAPVTLPCCFKCLSLSLERSRKSEPSRSPVIPFFKSFVFNLVLSRSSQAQLIVIQNDINLQKIHVSPLFAAIQRKCLPEPCLERGNN